MAGENGVPGFDFQAASSLFVIDRKGILAGVPNDFYFKLEEELERRLPDLLAGRPTPGPLLWSVQQLPRGWGEIWRVPQASGVTSLGIAPAAAKAPLEIGVLDVAHHLDRYSAKGVLLGEATIEDGGKGWWNLRGADLDGDGTNEWLAREGEAQLKATDSEGRPYWSYYGNVASEESFEFAGVTDLDADGFKEVVVREGDTVKALDSVGRPRWTFRASQALTHALVDARGGIWAQSQQGLFPIDARGRGGAVALPDSGSLQLKGEAVGTKGERLRLFGARHIPFVDADHDLDADGRKDIVIANRGGISAYDQEGRTILNLTIADSQSDPILLLADLDGLPGDEMILFVPQYGLVALGKGGSDIARK